MLLYEVSDVLKKAEIKFAIVGGYALALHGLVRATMDVDLVLSLTEDEFEKAEKALNTIKLTSRLPIRAQDVIKMREEYIQNRNLIAWSFVDYGNPSRQVDILITKDVRQLDVVKISVSGRKIPVASLKELLKMKKESARPQDLVDIENIKAKINEKNRADSSKKIKSEIAPEEAVRFLEDIRLMSAQIDEPTVAISLRVPGNILRALKLKAKSDGKKYQSLIIEYLRKGLSAS